MKINFDLIEKNPYSRPGISIQLIKGIVIHWVGNPMTSAKANRKYFEGLADQDDAYYRYASSHYIVDKDEIIQCVPTYEMAYHVGAKEYMRGIIKELSNYPNNCLIGIEVCHPDWEGEFEKSTLRLLKDLILMLCDNYDLNEEDLYRHFDITGKICPRYYVDYPEAWTEFKASIRSLLEYQKDSTYNGRTPKGW